MNIRALLDNVNTHCRRALPGINSALSWIYRALLGMHGAV